GTVLDARDRSGKVGQKAFDQLERDRDAGYGRDVVQVDTQCVVADPVDDLGKVAVQPLVADVLVVERRQHEYAGTAELHGPLRQRHRVGDGAASCTGHHARGIDAGVDQSFQ